ncbi:ATP-binding protein [Scytonema millei]|uniref:histidine kinase n=1 Tax=Scytonema millei VB511283 TaxID=1245923 RepID=A0A9X5E4C1_9CYAN|nr:ATP-binding protein [Scytonema millei]NHC34563.1 HAMP domain-containing protein [Scytonema millei VB511283]
MRFLYKFPTQVLGKTSLQNLLLTAFVLQVIAVVGLVGNLSFKNGQRAVNDLAERLQTQIAERLYLQLKTYLQTPHLLNQVNQNVIEESLPKASLDEFESLLLNQMQSFEIVPYTAWGNQKGKYVGIDRLRDGRLHIEVVNDPSHPKYYTYTVNSQGQRGKLVQVTPYYDPRTRPWYKEAVQKGKAAWSPVYIWFNQKEMAIDAVLPVYDQKRNLIGVLDTPLKLSRISDYLKYIPISKSGQIFILDRSGLLVASSDSYQPFSMAPGGKLQRLKASESKNPLVRSTARYLTANSNKLTNTDLPQRLAFNQDRQRYFVDIHPFRDSWGIDWLIVAVIPEVDFMEDIYATTRTTVLLCVLALLVAVIIGIFTTRWIAKPIQRLNASAKHIANGEWDKTVEELGRSDEIGELAKSFNSMAVELQKSFAEMQDLNAALSASERQLHQFLEAVPVGVIVHNSTSKISYANQTAQHLLGNIISDATSEELVKFYQLYRGDRPYPTEELPMMRALKGETVIVDDLSLHQDGKVLHLEVRATPIREDCGNIAYAIVAFTDISDRRRAEQEIRELNQSLERRVSDRTAELEAVNKELEAFSYSVSHDLRAPLRQIDGFSQILLSRYTDKLDDRGENYLQRICGNIQQMGELIDGLLALSRVNRSELQRTEVNLSQLATEIAAKLQETQPERQIEWAIAPEIIVSGDARLLGVLLENLLNNAWKYTANQTQPRIEFNVLHQENGQVVYFVRDNGAGFNMNYADKLFVAFGRLHSPAEFPGTGIGLATVQRVVHRHRGQIWAEGKVGEGATFYFTL